MRVRVDGFLLDNDRRVRMFAHMDNYIYNLYQLL